MKTEIKKGNPLALLPLGVFLVLFVGSGLITGDFYKMPSLVAFLIAGGVALLFNRKVSLEEKMNIFCKGAGDSNIILMVIIFLLAGAFSSVAKAMGGVDSTVNLSLSILPSNLLVTGLFIIGCFISVSMGTSVGTIAALAPIGLGISEKTGIEVEFIIGEFSSLFGYLDSGKANTVANLITVTEERKEKYDFSEPYAYIPQKMIVNENLKDVNKIDDLEGLKCAYVAGSNSGDLFKQLAKERNLNIDLQVFESGALMLEAFNQGKVNVFIAAENEGLARIKSGTIKARIADETINYVAEAYPFVKGDKNAQEINKIASDCIKEFRKDGTLSELETKWYTNDYSKEQVIE